MFFYYSFVVRIAVEVYQNFQKFLYSQVCKSGLIITFAVNPDTQSYKQIKILSETLWAIFNFCTEVW